MNKRKDKCTSNIEKSTSPRIQTSSLSTEERLKVIANLIIDKLIEINQNKLRNLKQ